MKKKNKTPIDCMKKLHQKGIWRPLACRESEILSINEFIDKSFSSKLPLIYNVYGDQSTGKTASVELCLLMTPFSNQISFYDCSQISPGLTNLANPEGSRSLVILDNFDYFPESKKLDFIVNSLTSNVSLLIISRTMMIFKNIPQGISILITKYSQYTPYQIVTILKEKLSSSANAISDGVFNLIAKKTHTENRNIIDAFNLLEQILMDAIQQNLSFIEIS
ncbi:hypothetical protein TRFO_27934 [Tritrichomonas foetus]|uniref:ATPase AAA-type core domain-containing protein n=1 Tax=Tritrichomonas foetus TaxID=1144522 RepID=A0A1J4K191_9EUKA|nr:hypothetical protein TRFO_27934 [Tritrichomonas foetus]|eukprot:OHT04552.1 hypothetical protein TRFO_27934 [Tritrichomonas foetus]